MIRRLTEIFRRCPLAAALLATVLTAFSGCGLVDSSSVECPEAGGEDQVLLSFRLVSGHLGSRSDNQGHEEIDSDWPVFEDAVNDRDFAFYIFFGEGNDAPLLAKVTDIANSTDPNMMITGTPGSYTVSVSIGKGKLEEVLGRKLDPESTEALLFRIVTLANTGGNYADMACATYGALMEAAGQWTFNMSKIYNDSSDGRCNVAEIYNGYIPMFGNKVFGAIEELLATTRPEDRLWLGEMSLLRALAKVKVIDNIADKKNGFPYVSSAKLTGTASRAYPLPSGAADYSDGSQVHTAKIAATGAGENTSFLFGYLDNPDSHEIFGYTPEQTIGGGSPVIKITVVFEADANGVPTKSATYDVPMTGYEDQAFDFGGGEILRNHIYTLSVDKVQRGLAAEISVSVAEWKMQTLTLDFKQNVTVRSKLTWDETTLKGNNTTTGTAVVLPWHDKQPVPAVATFNIDTPVGATWTAWFITKQGSHGAFMFVDDEGNRLESISGPVDERASTLRIIATEEDPAVDNEAEIQVVVQLGDGKYIEANVCSEQSYARYTIIQNRQ